MSLPFSNITNTYLGNNQEFTNKRSYVNSFLFKDDLQANKKIAKKFNLMIDTDRKSLIERSPFCNQRSFGFLTEKTSSPCPGDISHLERIEEITDENLRLPAKRPPSPQTPSDYATPPSTPPVTPPRTPPDYATPPSTPPVTPPRTPPGTPQNAPLRKKKRTPAGPIKRRQVTFSSTELPRIKALYRTMGSIQSSSIYTASNQKVALKKFVEGSFNQVFSIVDDQSPLVENLANQDLLIKVFLFKRRGILTKEDFTSSARDIIGYLDSSYQQYCYLEKMRKALLEEGIDIADIYNIPARDGYQVAQKIEGEYLTKEIVNPLEPFEGQSEKTQMILKKIKFLLKIKTPVNHLDAKPDNFVLKEDGTLILIDYTEEEIDESDVAGLGKKWSNGNYFIREYFNCSDEQYSFLKGIRDSLQKSGADISMFHLNPIEGYQIDQRIEEERGRLERLNQLPSSTEETLIGIEPTSERIRFLYSIREAIISSFIG